MSSSSVVAERLSLLDDSLDASIPDRLGKRLVIADCLIRIIHSPRLTDQRAARCTAGFRPGRCPLWVIHVIPAIPACPVRPQKQTFGPVRAFMNTRPSALEAHV